MIGRIKQGLLFLFGTYREEWNKEVKAVLSQEEFKIYENMSEYDRIHSFRLYQMVKKDEILKDEIYKKLALLHDCGKYNASLYRRIKKVLIGEKTLDNHSELSYEKLKNINLELAKLARVHHKKPEDKYMQRFQELDDK